MHFTKIQIKFTVTCNEDEQLDAKRMLKYTPNGQRQLGKTFEETIRGRNRSIKA